MRNRRLITLALSVLAFAILTATALAALSFKTRTYDASSSQYGVVIGDFNGDRDPDVVSIGDDDIHFLDGPGDGGPHSVESSPFDGSGWGLAAGRFDSDRKLDVVTGNKDDEGKVVLFRGNGDGTFKDALHYDVGSAPQSPAAADFNRDGRLDVAISNSGEGSVSVLLGKPGGFEDHTEYPVHQDSYAVATGKLNGDRYPDIVSADDEGQSLSVLLARPNGTFRPRKVRRLPDGMSPEDVAVGDLNGDGKQDLVSANYGGGSVSVVLGRGDGTFRRAKTYGSGAETWHVAVGDINGDGKLDVAAGNEEETFASVLLGRGDGRLRKRIKLDVGNFNSAIAVGRLDGRRGADVVSVQDAGPITVARSRP